MLSVVAATRAIRARHLQVRRRSSDEASVDRENQGVQVRLGPLRQSEECLLEPAEVVQNTGRIRVGAIRSTVPGTTACVQASNAAAT